MIKSIRRELQLLNALPPEKGMRKVFQSIGLMIVIRRSVAPMTFDYQIIDLASESLAEFRELRTYDEMYAVLAEMDAAEQA